MSHAPDWTLQVLVGLHDRAIYRVALSIVIWPTELPPCVLCRLAVVPLVAIYLQNQGITGGSSGCMKKYFCASPALFRRVVDRETGETSRAASMFAVASEV